MKNLVKFFFPICILAAVFTACLDEDFDQPPTGGETLNIEANTTIAELKSMHVSGQFETIDEDLIIRGIVVADDASGNWYRTFVVQDETGGIEILTDLRDSYVFYPRGREVAVKLKGLVMGDYNNLIQLGGYVAEDFSLGPVVEAVDFIVKGPKVTPPAAKVKNINDLTMADVSTLITLENVQFVTGDAGATFADAQNQEALNRTLEDCDKNEVLVRTSGFANFAGSLTPQGNGTFTGVLSVYRDDFQFLVRDLDDLAMTGDRCGGNGGGGCNGGTVPTVSGVEEDFESGANNDPVVISGWTNVAIKGSRNWQYKEFSGNVYAQATAFNDNSAEMETWLITPLIELTEPQMLSFETAKAFYTHAGLTVWISTDFECDPLDATWQPLTGATIAGQSDDDNEWIHSGNIDLAALVGQKFAIGFKYVGSGPNGQTGTFRVDNLKIGEGDPVGPCNGNPPLEVGTINQDFESGANNDPVALNGWRNYAATGTRNWIYKEFSGNVYVQATAFNDAAPETECWLVTPLIVVDGPKKLSFETAQAFWTHDGLTVWISEDYDCEPQDATWNPLNATLAGQSDPDHEWVPSGDIDLSGYMGKKIAIAFRYVGNNSAGQTASYRIDNLIVQ